jgi:hypothetical protein
MIRKALLLTILLSSLSLIFAIPQPLLFICGFLQIFILPGLVFTGVFLRTGFSRTDRVFYSIVISPILISFLVIAISAITGDIDLSARIGSALFYAFFLAHLFRRKDDHAEESETGVPWQVLLVSLSFAGLILFSYLYNSFLLIRSDSWYHASVINEIVNRGIPPKEPWLADAPINYMWFYHLFQTAWKELSGISAFWAMGIFNVITAFVFPYFIAKYISRFTSKKYLIVSAPIFAVAGLESVSWIFLPIGLLRVFFGEVGGTAEIQRMLSKLVINGSGVIHSLNPYGTWMVNLYDKFITITAFSFSLMLFLAALIIVLSDRFMKEYRVRSLISLYILMLGALFFHAVTGTALIMTGIGAGILAILLGKRFVEEKEIVRYGLYVAVVALLAAVTVLPYFLSLNVGSDGGEGGLISKHLHLSLWSTLTIVLPVAALYCPARDALRKAVRGRDYRSLVLVTWASTMFIIAIAVNLPTVNESKLIFPLFLVIGPPIYVEIVEKIKESSPIRRRLITVFVALLFLVPPVLTFRGFLIQGPDNDVLIRRYRIAEEDVRFFEWIKKNTPDDSIIMENNIYHLMPVYANRRNFYSTQGVIRMLGYDKEIMEYYGRIQGEVYGPDELSADTIESMRNFGSRLYVALWREDIESSPWLSSRFSEDSIYFKRVFSSERVSLYTLREDAD